MSEPKTPAPREPIRELSIADALEFAVQMLREGDLESGLKLCRRILEAVPDHPDALHFLGMGLYQQGNADEALVTIERAVAALPTYTDAWNNLGNILASKDRYAEAEAAYRKVLAIDVGHADAWNNLAAALKEQDRLEEGEQAARKALELAEAHPEAYQTLGNILRLQKRPKEALEAFRQAMLRRPQHPDSYRGLGAALYAVSQVEEAAEVYAKWVELEPDNPYPRHMLAACTGQDVPERAADGYVANTFDRFAATFDKVLAGLNYRAPQLIEQAVEEYLGSGRGQLMVADAGCGTGLCGPFLRRHARQLVGVDLSPAMIERARNRQPHEGPLYDELVVGELSAFFEQRPDTFDLVISADTLCYFGKLETPVNAMSRSLRREGLLCFTVEQASEEAAPDGFAIQPHGRYAQTETYVREVLKRAGLSAKLVNPVHLRMEKGKPVEGLLVLARKPPVS